MSKLVSKLTVKTAADHPPAVANAFASASLRVWPKLTRHDEKSRPSSRARACAVAVGELARGGGF